MYLDQIPAPSGSEKENEERPSCMDQLSLEHAIYGHFFDTDQGRDSRNHSLVGVEPMDFSEGKELKAG